jgi:hypothetical protein
MKPVSSVLRNIACIPLLLLGAACVTGPQPGGRPLPSLTFSELPPLTVSNVNSVTVEDRYDPSADVNDISARFPGPPNKLLATYAHQRLQPDGGLGTLHFIIEDAHVFQKKEEQENSVARALRLGESDEYKVGMKVTLAISYPDHAGPSSTLTFGRSTYIPRGDTLAEKEFKQLEFLEKLMKDVDKSVTNAVNGPLRGSTAGPGVPSYGVAPAYNSTPSYTANPPYGYPDGNDTTPAPLPDPGSSPF